MAIAAAREVTGKPVIVYPTSGETGTPGSARLDGQSRYSPAQPRQWVAAGAKIIGGCCRVLSAGIVEIAEALDRPGQPQSRIRMTSIAGRRGRCSVRSALRAR